MAINFDWTCPYCDRDVTITDSNYSEDIHYFSCIAQSVTGKLTDKYDHFGLVTLVVACPNKKCREYTIKSSLYKAIPAEGSSSYIVIGDPIDTWDLEPRAEVKQFPDYIPKAIIADYEEACLIKNLSPKASATLSRRCLQGIIRDFWGISKERLIDEINAIQEKMDTLTWKAIDSVRSIGNIGAHMEKDINFIIDVEPNEAQLLIELTEMLIKEWYIAKHNREEQLKNIIEVSDKKEKEKKAGNCSDVKEDK